MRQASRAVDGLLQRVEDRLAERDALLALIRRVEDHMSRLEARLVERLRGWSQAEVSTRAFTERIADAEELHRDGLIDDEDLADARHAFEYAAEREANGAAPLFNHRGQRLTIQEP